MIFGSAAQASGCKSQAPIPTRVVAHLLNCFTDLRASSKLCSPALGLGLSLGFGRVCLSLGLHGLHKQGGVYALPLALKIRQQSHD